MPPAGQAVPVRLYQTRDQLTLAAPMPGLQGEDISVTIQDDCISIGGEERGPGQHERDLILAEWNIGPFLRELTLPTRVRGALANATYGNGVLVVTIPKAKGDEPSSGAHFRLASIGPGRGERVGHQGKDAHPASTFEHVARKHDGEKAR